MGATEVQAGAEDEGVLITELEKFEVTRVDGVANPANGAPILLMKAMAGQAPEPEPSGAGCGCCPSCTCAPGAAKSAAEPVIATPLGVPDGIVDLAKEASRAVVDAYLSIDGPWSYMDGALAKRTFTADERRKAAAEGHALADGTYPIYTVDDLNNAAGLARSKHGNWKGASRLIAKMARKLGVRNPLKKKPKSNSDGGAAKSTVAEGGTAVDTGAQDDLTKAVQDAVTKATEPLAREIADLKSAKDHLQGELAKVQALPLPGGPVLSAIRPSTSDGDAVKKTRLLAKAEEYEELARTMTNPSDSDAYAKLAAQAREDAAKLNG